jgi:hypothetical protein
MAEVTLRTRRPRTLRPRTGSRAGRRVGWLLVVLGVVVALPTGAIFALITNLVPLAAIVPKTIRVTGPVEADLRAVLSFGGAFFAALVAIGQGAHRIARGAWSVKLLVGMVVLGGAGLAATLLAR